MAGSCCICARVLFGKENGVTQDFLDEKKQHRPPPPPEPPIQLACCQRLVCADCIAGNARFASYCPYCQVSTEPSPLPQGLREPPAYCSPPASPRTRPQTGDPPPYASLANGGSSTQTEDVVHHLHADDSVTSLALAYRVPISVLRAHNTLFADHLLSARRTLSIPASHYQGPSLSASPVESEQEAQRKASIRRFMVASKCHEYELAELYLGNAGGDLDAALVAWAGDEAWERAHPLAGRVSTRTGGKTARRAPP